MDKIFTAKFNMYEQNQFTCNENQIVWIGDVPFSTSFALFEGYMVTLRQKKAIQEEDVKGLTIDKENTRTALEAALLNVAVRVAAYAQVASNQALKKFMVTVPSTLKRMTEDAITTYAGDVYLKTDAVLGDLIPYGVIQDTLDDLKDKTDAWIAIKDMPLYAYDRKEKAREAIEQLVVLIDDVLINRLDLNVMVFQAEHPDFVAMYKESRTINDLPTTKLSLKGKVTDAVTTLPVPGADVHLVEPDIHLPTNQNGTFQCKNLPDGPLTIHVTFPGYNLTTYQTMIFPGQTVTVAILMERS